MKVGTRVEDVVEGARGTVTKTARRLSGLFVLVAWDNGVKRGWIFSEAQWLEEVE